MNPEEVRLANTRVVPGPTHGRVTVTPVGKLGLKIQCIAHEVCLFCYKLALLLLTTDVFSEVTMRYPYGIAGSYSGGKSFAMFAIDSVTQILYLQTIA